MARQQKGGDSALNDFGHAGCYQAVTVIDDRGPLPHRPRDEDDLILGELHSR